MTVEWRNETESLVEKIGRSSMAPNGSLMLIPVSRMRQPLVAKEPLCGNQSTNLSLAIAVFCFPSCFVIPLFWLMQNKEDFIEKNIKIL